MPQVELLPVTRDPEGMFAYIDQNFRRIADAIGRTVSTGTTTPASQVTAGTFGTGDYVFPGALDVTGVLRAKTGSIAGQPGPNRFWGGLELAHPSSTPYIDFHRSANPEEATDYNVRLINQQNLELDLVTGNMPWAAFRAGHAHIGSWGWDSNWVMFGHTNRISVDSASYQYMAHSGGDVIVNAPNGATAYVRQNGANRFQVDSAVHTSVRFNVTGGLYLWSDWIRIGGSAASNGIHWEAYGGGIIMQDTTWVRLYGGKSFYAGAGQIRTDGKLVASAQNGSTGLWLYNDSDPGYRVIFEHATSGTRVMGWNDCRLESSRFNTMVEAGRVAASVRHVNIASSVWHDSEAATHWNRSDPKFKENIRSLPSQAQKVRAIKAIAFEAKDGAEPGRSHFGFDATELPPEVVRKSKLIKEGSDTETIDSLMVDTTGLVAILWQTVSELIDRINILETRRV